LNQTSPKLHGGFKNNATGKREGALPPGAELLALGGERDVGQKI